MTIALQIGDVYDGRSSSTPLPTEIISFLTSYNLIPQLLSQTIIESAIAPITCTQSLSPAVGLRIFVASQQ